jgi:hypothetical protein
MKARPSPGLLSFLTVMVVVLVFALPALAYQYPLSSADVREAYLLGTRRDSLTASFFAKYRHDLRQPRTGPWVSDIIIETPYTQVVEMGQADQNPDTQQAEIDLPKKNFLFIVRVGINFTDTYPSTPKNPPEPRPIIPDFEKDFKIRMSQKDKKIIQPSSVKTILLDSGDYGNGQITGAVLELTYKSEDIDPSADLAIKVLTPDDQDVETTFDLNSLK